MLHHGVSYSAKTDGDLLAAYRIGETSNLGKNKKLRFVIWHKI